VAEAANRTLALRVVSSVILAAVTAAVIWYGPPAFDIYILAAAVVLALEWRRLCGEGAWSVPSLAFLATTVATVAVASLIDPRYGLAACGVGVPAVLVAASHARGARPDKAAPGGWLAFGALYIGLPGIALIWIAGDPQWGRETLVVLIAAVAATDIGAYFTGRAIAGPKLAPRVSPGKTWAGLVGGIACGAAVSAALGPVLGYPPALGAALGGGLAVISQMGDLFESAIKRRFGVKDSGGIIPGHGGLFDRVDGHIAAACAVAAAQWATGGSVLTWR